MDWVAVGALATVALVFVGVAQWRASKRPLTTQPEPAKIAHVPTLHYAIATGSGSFPLPSDWEGEISDPRWATRQMMAHALQGFGFAAVTLDNRSDEIVRGLRLELQTYRPWSAQVKTTTAISKSAVNLGFDRGNLHIDIEELPGREKVRISILAGTEPSEYLSVRNAAVKLEKLRD